MKFYKQYKDKGSKPIEITESEARNGLEGSYGNLDLMIQTLKDGQRVQTNFAIYWAEPKER